jgi:hypothetical protein
MRSVGDLHAGKPCPGLRILQLAEIVGGMPWMEQYQSKPKQLMRAHRNHLFEAKDANSRSALLQRIAFM